jgi:hypothetical protein
VSFQRKVLLYPRGDDAFQRLTDAGFNRDLLWRHLWGLASLKLAARKEASRWYGLPGYAPNTVRRFPGRVRSMADEIEKLSERIRSNDAYRMADQFLPLLLPSAHVKIQVEGESVPVIDERNPPIRGFPSVGLRAWSERQKFAELPKLLRLYADYIAVLSRLVAHGAPRGAGTLKAMMPLELIHAAKVQTGKYFRDDIAIVLEAAYSAIGINETVDPRNLMMQYWRRVSRKK